MTDASESRDHGGHPDLDALAALQAGAPEATDATRAHVASCARCSAELATLDRIPALLASAGAVGPMPVEVVTAVDAALASEAAGTDESAEAPDGGAARTVVPLGPTRDRSPLGTRLLQAAAVVVLLLAGLGVGISALGGGGSDAGSGGSTADSATAGKAAERGGYPLTASGRNWDAGAITTGAPQLVAGTLSPPVAANELRQQYAASERARDDAGGAEAATPTAAPTGSAARLAGGPALAACVAALADGPVTPLAVDIAGWQGNPAAVIVLPFPGDPSRAEVWVVEPSCSTSDAKLLYYANVPR